MKHRKSLLLILFTAFTLIALGQQAAQDHKILFEKAKFTMETKGDLKGAITLFGDLIKKYPKEREYAAKSQLYIGECYEKLGNAQARAAYERVVRDYADQTETVTLAKAKLTHSDDLATKASPEAEQSSKLAADLFKQLKYAEAVSEYEKVIKLAPKTQLAQEAQLWIGNCYSKMGKNELALKSFGTILKDYPKSNLVPVAEIMISQVKQSMGKEPTKNPVIVLDDKTILDTISGIRYTKVNSWAGKNDLVKYATSIASVSPNRKFMVAGSKIIPFVNSDPIALFDSITFPRSGKLSPDGTQVAAFTKNSVSIVPVSPESGRPTGPVKKLLTKQYTSAIDLNWSPDGKSLLLSMQDMNKKFGIWTLSVNDTTMNLLKSTYYRCMDLMYSKNGNNVLYNRQSGGANFGIEMKSTTAGKSVAVLDFCASTLKSFGLSPSNQWIVFKQWAGAGEKFLYRMADQQQMKLSTPIEVGDFVAWTNDENKLYFYSPSSSAKYSSSVASVYGGPALDLSSIKDLAYIISFGQNNGELLVLTRGEDQKSSIKLINLTNQESKTFEGIGQFTGIPSISPDGSKMCIISVEQGVFNLTVLPVSLKDGKVTGKPIRVFDKFLSGMAMDFSWSPDGKRIAVCSRKEVWICSADGGNPIQLTRTPETINFPQWSPDGSVISVYVTASKQLKLLKSENGESIMKLDSVFTWDWIPDRKELTIACNNGRINVLSLESGATRTIANWKELTGCTGLTEIKNSPDGKLLLINGYRSGTEYSTNTMLVNNMDGKTIKFTGNNEKTKESYVWSPDGKWLSYMANIVSKKQLESTLWEADLTGFMKKMKPGTAKGFTTDFDFKVPALPAGGVSPDGTFTDSRDDHAYKYKKIGTQTWMTENLAYLPEVSPDSINSTTEKRYYVYGYKGSDPKEAKNTENYQKYGVLYNWPATMEGSSSSSAVPSGVQGVCPAGWHIPSDAEWMILEKELGMNDADMESPEARLSGSVDKKLKSPLGWNDDNLFLGQSGFNALPAGMILQRSNSFGQKAYAYFSSATIVNDRPIMRVIYENLYLRTSIIEKNAALPIRCIKD